MKNLLNYIIALFLIIFLFACDQKSPNNVDSKKIEPSKIVTNEAEFVKENDSLLGIKFSVDNVVKNNSLLETYDSKAVIENFIGTNVTYFPHENDSLLKLVPISGNGLINTINLCYGQHRPLVLTPDIIWFTIAQGVSTHINKDFKNLEGKLFNKNKPKSLRVRNDSLEYGEKHWQDLIRALTDSTKKYTQDDMFSFLAPKFSTTTEEIYTAYQANILYGYKKAFTYVGEGGCGIPYITVTGTKKDWIDIKSSLPKLNELGLDYWAKELEPIIDQFISLYNNDIDELFWKNIYKEFLDYGEYSISGWIIKFYPYMEVLGNGTYDEEKGMMKIKHEFKKNEFLFGDKYLFSTLNIDDFPNYKSEANILWLNYFKNEQTKIFLYSGIMGAKQYQDGSLKPWITWAISTENNTESKPIRSKSNEIVHRDPSWVPYVYNNDSTIAQKALYPIKKNNQFEESILEFTQVVYNAIGDDNHYKGDTLTFYILSNGKPLIITNDKKLEFKVQNYLDKKGIKWEPAKIKLSEIMMMSDEIDSSKLIKVNSKIEIILENK